MKLKRRVSIKRSAVENALQVLQMLLGKMELGKKMRVIIDYDPQATKMQINYFTDND